MTAKAALAVLLLGGVGGLPSAMTAQEWSEDQQELIDFWAGCADAWVESQEKGDPDVYFSFCPGVGESPFWYLARPAPVVYEGPDGYWAMSKASGATARWTDMDPVRVDVMGDVAVYYFTATWEIETPDGAIREVISNRVRVFKREGGRWLRAGGAGANLG